jgi:hypothetical protein
VTPQPSNPPPVILFGEVERILTQTEAVRALEAAGEEDSRVPDPQRAAIMAAVGQALRLLRQEHEEVDGAPVATTAQHMIASRLQSLIASGEGGTLDLTPLSTGGLEAKFDTGDWGGWAKSVWAYLTSKKFEPMPRPSAPAPDPFPEKGRIAVLGDWATGLYGAPKIAAKIAADPDSFAMLLHLGDVYYSGTDGEVKERFHDIWPVRNDPGLLNRAINSNHEMYSGGAPYFTKTLPKFNQKTSYFAHQNANWTLVGLDVAYKDHDIDDQQVEWLKGILAQSGDRRVVLFSHHQLYSHFESQGKKLFGHPEFKKILESRRIFAWYWGHEHRCTLFEGPDAKYGLLGRCIGNSGMPQSRKKTRNLPQAGQPVYSKGEWRRSAACVREGNTLADCVVLEGPNPDIPGEEEKFSPHSYAVLTLEGKTLKEEIVSPAGAVLYDKVIAS